MSKFLIVYWWLLPVGLAAVALILGIIFYKKQGWDGVREFCKYSPQWFALFISVFSYGLTVNQAIIEREQTKFRATRDTNWNIRLEQLAGRPFIPEKLTLVPYFQDAPTRRPIRGDTVSIDAREHHYRAGQQTYFKIQNANQLVCGKQINIDCKTMALLRVNIEFELQGTRYVVPVYIESDAGRS